MGLGFSTESVIPLGVDVDTVLFILFVLEENNLQHPDQFQIVNMQKKNIKFCVIVVNKNMNLVLITSLGSF